MDILASVHVEGIVALSRVVITWVISTGRFHRRSPQGRTEGGRKRETERERERREDNGASRLRPSHTEVEDKKKGKKKRCF